MELYPMLPGYDSRLKAFVSSGSVRAAPHVNIQTLASPKSLGDGMNLVHQVTVNGEKVYASTSLTDTLREVRKILARHRANLKYGGN